MTRRRWLFALLGAAVLLPALLFGWLLGTTSGLRFVFAQAAGALPDLALTAERIEGRLASARLAGLSLQVGERALRIESLEIDWRPLSLVGTTLEIARLRVGEMTIGAAPAAQEEAAPIDPDRMFWEYPLPELPFSVELGEAILGPATLAGEPLWDGLALSGSLAGRQLDLGRFELSRGADAVSLAGRLPADTQARGLRGLWRFNGAEGRLALAADARGGALALSADQQRAELAVSVQGPRDWQLRFRAREARLAALLEGLPEPLSAEFSLQGQGASARLSGSWPGGPLPLQSLQGGVRWQADAGALQVDAVSVEHAAGGRVQLDGQVDVAGGLALQLDAQLEDWPLPGAAEDAQTRLRGSLSLRGPTDDLALQLVGTLSRAEQTLPLQLDARWQDAVLSIERLLAEGAGGRLEATGSLRTEPALALELKLSGEDFDPGWLVPGLDASIGFDADLQAGQHGDRWDAALQVERLQGRWRDAPISGQGNLSVRDGVLGGDLAIALGAGQLRVQAEDQQLDVEVRRLPLGAVQPGLGGLLDGSLIVERMFDAPSWEVDLVAQDLSQDDLRVARAELSGGLDSTGTRTLRLAWQGASYADLLEGVSGMLQLEGHLGAHQGRLSARAEQGELSAAWRAELGDVPLLELEALTLDGAQIGAWELANAGPVRFGDPLQVAPHCLRSGEISLCLRAEQGGPSDPGEVLALRLEGLPLQRLLALGGAPESLRASGEVSTRIALRTSPSLELHAVEGVIGAGELRDLSPEQPVSLLAWDSLRWTLASEEERLRVMLAGRLQPEGRVTLDLAVPRSAPADSSQWQGLLEVDIDQLQALALLAPDLTAARGALRGRLRWEPGLAPDGEIMLEAFSARVPQLGIAIRDSSLSLRQDDAGLQVDGLLDTGEGLLRVEGSVQPGDALRARVRIAGDGVLLADTRRLALRASPELTIGVADGQIRLRGEVRIPRALIDLERLEAGVQVSPDVVVMDPRDGAVGMAAMPLDADLKVVLGDDVRLDGFGFEGTIRGTLALRERPGRPMLGRGTLDLGGSYRAYGQELEIDRGRLLFASSPLDNPGIDLRARRPLREVEVGVEVRGPARRPQLSLWSRPALDQAEALSWLVLGQPLASATEADGAQLGQAAAAVGGNLLAAKVGGRLGFDTFGVADSDALGAAAFTVGKYLSPRLYISYGVALFEEGRVITLRYLINRSFDIELEAAKESRVGVNYRLETD